MSTLSKLQLYSLFLFFLRQRSAAPREKSQQPDYFFSDGAALPLATPGTPPL